MKTPRPHGEVGGTTIPHAPSPAKPFGFPHAGIDPDYRLAPRTDRVHPAPPPRATPTVQPTPLPKRPKGRLLVGTFLVSLCAIGGYTVWNSLLRYEAYGVVQGRVIDVPPPWEGVVQSLLVREGDSVRQGQPVATVQSLDLEHDLARTGDELRLAQATLDAAVAELRFAAQQRGDRRQRALAEYYELSGELLQERAELAHSESKLQRMRELGPHATASERETLEFAVAGRKAKIEKLAAAVEERRRHVELTEAERDNDCQLQPHLLRLTNLQNELARLRSQIERSQVRSPVNGRIVRSRCATGEHVEPTDTLFEILEDGSQELVLYVPQSRAARFAPGKSVTVHGALPNATTAAQVVRIGERFERPPGHLARYYHENVTLLPVVLKPLSDDTTLSDLRVGSEIRLPMGSGK